MRATIGNGKRIERTEIEHKDWNGCSTDRSCACQLAVRTQRGSSGPKFNIPTRTDPSFRSAPIERSCSRLNLTQCARHDRQSMQFCRECPDVALRNSSECRRDQRQARRHMLPAEQPPGGATTQHDTTGLGKGLNGGQKKWCGMPPVRIQAVTTPLGFRPRFCEI